MSNAINYPALRAVRNLYIKTVQDGIMPSYDMDGSYYDDSWVWEVVLEKVAERFGIDADELEHMSEHADNIERDCFFSATQEQWYGENI